MSVDTYFLSSAFLFSAFSSGLEGDLFVSLLNKLFTWVTIPVFHFRFHSHHPSARYDNVRVPLMLHCKGGTADYKTVQL